MSGRVAVAGVIVACILSLGALWSVTEARKDVMEARQEAQDTNEQLWLLLMTVIENQHAIYDQCSPGVRASF